MFSDYFQVHKTRTKLHDKSVFLVLQWLRQGRHFLTNIAARQVRPVELQLEAQ